MKDIERVQRLLAEVERATLGDGKTNDVRTVTPSNRDSFASTEEVLVALHEADFDPYVAFRNLTNDD